MNYRTTLTLAVIAVLVGVGLIVQHKHVPPTQESPSPYVLPEVKHEDIKSVEIVVGDRTLVLERRGEGTDATWEIVKPIKARADKTLLTTLTSDLHYLYSQGFIEEADAKTRGDATYGLDKPQASAVARTSEAVYRFRFGAANPAKLDQVYCRAEAEPAQGVPGVHIVDAKVLETLKKSPEEFQDRTLVTLDTFKVDKIELGIGGDAVELVKKQYDWLIEKPEDVKEKAEYTPVSSLLNDLRDLRWKDWVEEKPADLDKYGLKTPAARVSLASSEAKKTETLLIGAPVKDNAERTWVRRGEDGPVVTVETAAAGKLPRSVDVFRSKKPFNLSADSLRKIAIRAGGDACVVEHPVGMDDWVVTQPAGQKVDRDEVTDFITVLNSSEIATFYERKMIEPKTYGLDQPKAQLEVAVSVKAPVPAPEGDKSKETKTEDKIESQVWAFGVNGGRLYAKREDRGQVVEFPMRLLSTLQLGSLNFKSKLLVDTKPENLQSFTLERLERGHDKPVVYAAVREGGQWKLRQPEKAEIDASKALGVVATLHTLRAGTWAAASGDPATYGLDHPLVKVEFAWTETKEVPKTKKADPDKKDAPKPEGEKKAEPEKGGGGEAGKKPEDKKEEIEKVTETFHKILRVGSKVRDGYYAQIEGDPVIFTMAASAVEALDQDLTKKEKEKEGE